MRANKQTVPEEGEKGEGRKGGRGEGEEEEDK